MIKDLYFDDIEIINDNGLNALLKILEEPSKNNYFILLIINLKY